MPYNLCSHIIGSSSTHRILDDRGNYPFQNKQGWVAQDCISEIQYKLGGGAKYQAKIR